MVSLSETGRLECGYLGTDPAIFVPPTVDARELNYADMDAEMRKLQRKIKENAHKSGRHFEQARESCACFSFFANNRLEMGIGGCAL